ncbi:MAG: large conductance mechanosensitive channel protein MscL [Cyanobacteria bacterium J055]|nr:MAG: large conductance mechanosensitive channel protein MscL [Cyanobacteria bacterium J055]
MARTSRNTISRFFNDFREFALQGNVLDLAIAVIIGSAFGKIITSFVEDLVMPGIINPMLGQTGDAWRETTFLNMKIGSFLGNVVDFAIIALVIFIAVRALERMKRKEALAEAEPEPDPNILVQQRLIEALERLSQTIESKDL